MGQSYCSFRILFHYFIIILLFSSDLMYYLIYASSYPLFLIYLSLFMLHLNLDLFSLLIVSDYYTFSLIKNSHKYFCVIFLRCYIIFSCISELPTSTFILSHIFLIVYLKVLHQDQINLSIYLSIFLVLVNRH